MDLNELKRFVQQDGGKWLIVEDDKPIMVVLSYDEYVAKIRGTNESQIRERQDHTQGRTNVIADSRAQDQQEQLSPESAAEPERSSAQQQPSIEEHSSEQRETAEAKGRGDGSLKNATGEASSGQSSRREELTIDDLPL